VSLHHYYVQVFVLGFGILTRYYTDTVPPGEGEVMNLRKISEMVGIRKVVKIQRTSSKEEGSDIEVVEILLDKDDIQRLDKKAE